MKTSIKLARIAGYLATQGESGSNAQIARLLDVRPSTIGRWYSGETSPRHAHEISLDLLFRTLERADIESGIEGTAQKMVDRMLTQSIPLLSLGYFGVLLLTGLGWLVEGEKDE